MKKEQLVEMLYRTEAFKVAPADRPFWYTSGKIGPFYINTHYLYGSAAEAEALLAGIDARIDEPRALTAFVQEETEKQYRQNAGYRALIDSMAACIRALPDADAIDMISGGARRDWFFSVQCARLLHKPHLSVFKDRSIVLGFGDDMIPVGEDSLGGAVCLHVADLVTEASSYVRAWIPAIQAHGGTIRDTVAVVDRCQGGGAALSGHGVRLHTLLQVDSAFFEGARALSLIDDAQLAQLKAYESDPDGAMEAFFAAHPDFLPNTLAALPAYGGEKAAQRARIRFGGGQ